MQQHSETDAQIAKWEAYVAHPAAPFSWEAHNELRHLYLSRDEAQSMSHADTILRHSLMDDYILDVLSEWHMDTDKQRAIIALMDKIERFPNLLYLRVAGLIRVGDCYEKLGQSEPAASFYRDALNSTEAHWNEETLKPYLKLAQLKLSI